MDILSFVWGWLITHGSGIITGITNIKLIAETADRIKKLAPEKLEVKELTQAYTNKTIEMLDAPDKSTEEKHWEVQTRKELVQSLVQATAIEATYNIARYAIFSASAMFMLHLFTRVITRPRKQ